MSHTNHIGIATRVLIAVFAAVFSVAIPNVVPGGTPAAQAAVPNDLPGDTPAVQASGAGPTTCWAGASIVEMSGPLTVKGDANYSCSNHDLGVPSWYHSVAWYHLKATLEVEVSDGNWVRRGAPADVSADRSHSVEDSYTLRASLAAGCLNADSHLWRVVVIFAYGVERYASTPIPFPGPGEPRYADTHTATNFEGRPAELDCG